MCLYHRGRSCVNVSVSQREVVCQCEMQRHAAGGYVSLCIDMYVFVCVCIDMSICM